MSWIIWIAGSILVVVTFEPGTLAFFVGAGLVFIVASTTSGWSEPTAAAGTRVAKD